MAKETKPTKKPAKKKAISSEKSETVQAVKAKPAQQRLPLIGKTYLPKDDGSLGRWQLIDATGLTLGRLATYVASGLMGKNKPQFTKFMDVGDHFVIINAEKINLTGKKWSDKFYHYHTGYPGGVKSFTPQDLLRTNPERIITRAVYGMLPKGPMGRKWFSKLHVYAGNKHPHIAQKPELVKGENIH